MDNDALSGTQTTIMIMITSNDIDKEAEVFVCICPHFRVAHLNCEQQQKRNEFSFAFAFVLSWCVIKDAYPAIPRNSTFAFVVHVRKPEMLAGQCLRLKKVMHLKRHFSLSLLNFVDWPNRLSPPK